MAKFTLKCKAGEKAAAAKKAKPQTFKIEAETRRYIFQLDKTRIVWYGDGALEVLFAKPQEVRKLQASGKWRLEKMPWRCKAIFCQAGKRK